MKKLNQTFLSRLKRVNTSFKRYLWYDIDWDNRLIAITGAWGVGKTTFLLQYINEKHGLDFSEVLYISLDNIYSLREILLSKHFSPY